MTINKNAVHPLYSDFDREKPEYDELSICIECAKHPSLKRFIQENAIEGPVCGVCQYVGNPYPVCDLGKQDELTNLMKALVRFYYNEYDYNPHWGGDYEPEGLLVESNPILEDQSSHGRTRSAYQSNDFLYSLFSAEPYPPVDKGISVYAGFDDGIRHLQFALKDANSPLLRDFQTRVTKENHFDIEPDLLTLIGEFAPRVTNTLTAGSKYFRARIGVAGKYVDDDSAGWHQRILSQPYSGDALGAPPPQFATAGRLNRAGVAFLYLASDISTAAAEVRPHPGHFLSVGEFENEEDLKIASFEADISLFAGNEHDLSLFHFIHSADETMALPVVPDHGDKYSITQIIAECLRQKGFDGVSFKSSVEAGQNLCLFRPDAFTQIVDSAQVLKVKSLSYGTELCPMILNPEGYGRKIS